jgi:hypothetical protein
MKNAPTFAILSFLLLLTATLTAQSVTFQKISSPPASKLGTTGQTTLITSKGRYLVLSWTNRDQLGSSISGNDLLMMMDTAGQVLWQKQYLNGGFNVVDQLVEAPDGGFVLYGHYLPNNSEYVPMLFKIDSVGNFLWAKKMNSTVLWSGAQYILWCLMAVPDGYILSGTRNGVSNGSILHVDQDGNTLWNKGYNYVPVADYQSGDTLFTTGVYNEKYIMAKINLTDGTVYNAHRIVGNNVIGTFLGTWANRLIPSQDGNFFLTGNGGITNDTFSCIKITRNGKVKWAKLYKVPGDNMRMSDFHTTLDGGLICIATFGYPSNTLMFKLDSLGVVQWVYRMISDLNAVTEDSDGHLLFTGDKTVDDTRRLLLLKTDAFGLTHDCCFPHHQVKTASYPVSTAPFTPVVSDLAEPGWEVYQVDADSLSMLDYCEPEYQPRFTNQEMELCPGESIFVNGTNHVAPATVVTVLKAQNGCDSTITLNLKLRPYNTRTKTLEFCPGDTIHLLGHFYTQPATVFDTLHATLACDTILTYMLNYANANQSSALKITCPPAITVTTAPGVNSKTATFGPPTVQSDCTCPGISLLQTQGPVSGSAFPVGATMVCFSASDSYHSTATCCFQVTVKSPPVTACDVKEIGCMKYELLHIYEDAQQRKSYEIQVTNHCADEMVYVAIQQPDGIVADAPVNGSVFTTAAGRSYDVRNPNETPFYSIRYKAQGTGLQNGQSDVFRYTLPPQADPTYIHIVAKLTIQTYVEAYLNTFYCPVEKAPVISQRNDAKPETASNFSLYPNPTTGTLSMNLSAWPDQPVYLTLYDVRGRLCSDWKLTGTTKLQDLELSSNLENGLYLLKISVENQTPFVKRFVLLR